MRPLPPRLAAGLVFLSSGAVLVLEIVGLRLVGPYAGVTLQTSSGVIGVALGSIAYGAWFGGRLADRRDPRKLLGPCLLLAALSSALTVPLVRYAGELLRGTNPLSIVLLSMLALFVPAALLSAVTPLVMKLQLLDLRQTGRVVGRLSSIGTLGAITATLGTGFVLVSALPTSRIVMAVSGVLALSGLGLMAYLGSSRRGGFFGALLAFSVAGAIAGAGYAPNPCDAETAYHCAQVMNDETRPAGRVLWLNSARQSYVDLADPTHLEFTYTQWIGQLVESMAEPRVALDVLHIGGGAFTMPSYLVATRPKSQNLVLELDADLVRLDEEKLGVRPGPALHVLTGDARVHLAEQPEHSRDLIIGDAFGHWTVPWHLTTRELVAQVERVLRPAGVYALNIIDSPPVAFTRAELATICTVFAYVALVAPPDALSERVIGANYVVVASNAPLPLGELGRRLAVLPRVVTMISGADLKDFIGSAQVLTDDYAPVDQLRASSGML